MAGRGTERGQQVVRARKEARRRVEEQEAAKRRAAEERRAAATRALEAVFSADERRAALEEELARLDDARREAVADLVDAVGRAEAATLLGVPERSLRQAPKRRSANGTSPPGPDQDGARSAANQATP